MRKSLGLLGRQPSLLKLPDKIEIPLVFCSSLPIFAVLFREKSEIVIFWDTSSDHKFLTRSTSAPKETIKWEDGKEYPVIKVEVSSASHPFFTGKKLFVDTAGRVEKFKNKYQKKS
jgi:large subunit ribosomal protein L31